MILFISVSMKYIQHYPLGNISLSHAEISPQNLWFLYKQVWHKVINISILNLQIYTSSCQQKSKFTVITDYLH